MSKPMYEPSTRGPSNFRVSDVKRIVKAVEAAGLKVGRIEIDGTKVTVITATDDNVVELDRVLL